MLGVLSVFYAQPHHPTPESLALRNAHLAVGAQAADASRALLPMLARTDRVDIAMLSITARHLALVADELTGNLKHHRGAKYRKRD